MQRRLLEGNITRLRGEAARDANDRVRSPLTDPKDGEEGSESTADDSAEERESLEESERSLRSDEEEDDEAGARPEKTESSAPLAALVVQCKVERRFFSRDSSRRRPLRAQSVTSRVRFSAESW